MSITYEDWLMHHGILGQRWGRKNGPPYPLGASDHSASEKRAGWRKSLDRSSSGTKKKFKLSDRQKTALKIGAGVAVAGLAVYGGYKLSQIHSTRSIEQLAQEFDIDLTRRAGASESAKDIAEKASDKISGIFNPEKAKQIAAETGFQLKDKPNTTQENCKLANPNFGNPDYRNNCGHSTIAWYLNELGLKVNALPVDFDYRDGGMVPNELNRYFKGLDWGIPAGSPPGSTTMRLSTASSKHDITKKVLELSNGENAVGIWRAPGHFMGWKVENGTVTFVNPQAGVDNCDDWFRNLDSKRGQFADRGIDIARLDNIEINPSRIKKAVTSS